MKNAGTHGAAGICLLFEHFPGGHRTLGAAFFDAVTKLIREPVACFFALFIDELFESCRLAYSERVLREHMDFLSESKIVIAFVIIESGDAFIAGDPGDELAVPADGGAQIVEVICKLGAVLIVGIIASGYRK